MNTTELKGQELQRHLTVPVVEWLLENREEPSFSEELGRILAATGTFEPVAADRVFGAVRAVLARTSATESGFTTLLASGGNTPLGLWLRARWEEEQARFEQALNLWNTLAGFPWLRRPEVSLARVRNLVRSNRPVEAWAEVGEFLRRTEDSHLMSGAYRVVSRLKAQCPPPGTKKLRVALLASTTTGIYRPILELAGLREGLDLEVWEGPYGNTRQQILTVESELYKYAADVVLIMSHWRDVGAETFTREPESLARQIVEEWQGLWATLLKRHPCRVIQSLFDVPPDDSAGHLSTVLPEGRVRVLRLINHQLLTAAPPAVCLFDQERLAARGGPSRWFEPGQWFLARQFPAIEMLPELARQHLALMRAGLGLSRKVLVLDLDNTLWGGIIGEDGLDGIQIGPPSAVGEAYQAFQKYLRELKDRGILLAVCSKNNEADARLPFEQHDGMVLKLDDFVVFRANWQDKPTNLRAMAATLSLGIDSFVFVDDNPVERDLMRRELPEVAVPEIGPDPAGYIGVLDRQRYFEALTLSAEDRERHLSYQANVHREELKQSSGSLESFLKNLQMVVTSGPVQPRSLDRVVQLINKTNQFNVTTRRYAAEDVTRMMSSEHWWTRYFKLSDRYGDNGLVGVLMARATGENLAEWEIDTFLMSCRVIGRRMEDYMLSSLLADLDKRGAKRVIGVYVPSSKNSMVAELYPRLGFRPLKPSAGENAERRFELCSPFPCPELSHMSEKAEDQPENSRRTS